MPEDLATRRPGRTCRSRTFPAVPDQAREARRFLAPILDGTPLADDALTCLSELVSNSIIHSDSRRPGGTFTVTVETSPRRIRVEVHDHGGPWAPSTNRSNGTSGRGLLVVATLADHWGINPTITAAARTAWFEMTLP